MGGANNRYLVVPLLWEQKEWYSSAASAGKTFKKGTAEDSMASYSDFRAFSVFRL